MTTRAIIALAACAGTAAAGINYDETVDGDLSNDRFNPTNFVLGTGVSNFTMDVIDSDQPTGDLDYFSVTIGAGLSIDSIILTDASNPNGGFDAIAFLALEVGPQISVDPAIPDPSPLAGFFLSNPTLVGTEVLDDLTNGGTSLGEGTYSLWVQQTGTDLTRISLAFNVVPAPGSAAALGCLGLLASRRRR